jgi:hypothetical protein
MTLEQRGSQMAAIQHRFRIDRGSAAVLLELFLADHPLPRSVLAASGGISVAAVKVRVSELRAMFERRMDGEAIDTLPGEPPGYALTTEGRAVCRMAFIHMATDLMQGLAL